MKRFLYCLVSQRNGDADGVLVFGGNTYYHHQLLVVIDAVDVSQAAQCLNVTIVDSFDRSKSNLPTIYYTSKPHKSIESYFFLTLKEIEESDKDRFLNLEEKIKFKVMA